MFDDIRQSFYKKDKLNFECHEDGSFVDFKTNQTLTPDDAKCHNPQFCFGQSITEAMASYIDDSGLSYTVEKSMLYYTYSIFKDLSLYRLNCYIGGIHFKSNHDEFNNYFFLDVLGMWSISNKIHQEYFTWDCQNQDLGWSTGLDLFPKL